MIKNFFKSSFSKNVLTLVSGTTIAQAIPVLISPILTRIYEPEDFGVFALYLSISGIISVIATGRYELAIILPKKDKDAINLLALTIILSFITSLIIFVVIIFFKENIANLLNNPGISNLLYFIPLSILFTGIYQGYNFWTNRQKKYKRISFGNITQGSTTGTGNLIMGYAKFGAKGLILGTVFGQAAAAIYFIISNKKTTDLSLVNKNNLKKVLNEYADFPLKSSISILFNLLANQLPVLLIGSFFGTTILGFYSLILRVLNLPLSIIGRSVSQVYFQTTNQITNPKELYQFVRKTTFRLFVLIIIPMSVILFWGDEIFGFVLGAKWVEAGNLAKIFVLFYFVRFIFSSQSTMLTTKRKLGLEARFNLFFMITQLFSLYIGYYFFDSYIYSFVFMSISGFVMFVILGVIIFRLSKLKIETSQNHNL